MLQTSPSGFAISGFAISGFAIYGKQAITSGLGWPETCLGAT
jgi:hypothetical protein